MRTSEKLENITKSIIDFQKECPILIKDKQTKHYNYCSLDNLINTLKPILSKHGIIVVQSVGDNGNRICITTRLQHVSGEYLEDWFTLDSTNMQNVNNTQAMGASITYGKRYGISAMLNIATDDDTDATSHQNTAPQPSKRVVEPVKAMNPLDVEILGLIKQHGVVKGAEKWQQYDDSKKMDMIQYYKTQLSAGKQQG